jgi:hypothetical protein
LRAGCAHSIIQIPLQLGAFGRSDWPDFIAGDTHAIDRAAGAKQIQQFDSQKCNDP